MSEHIQLTDLIEVDILQQMQDSFAKMARMAAVTTDSEGAVVTAPSNFSDMCANYCRKSPEGKRRCEACDKNGALKSMSTNTPVSYKCHANLVDFAAPIMLGDEMIGTFVGGQVLSEAPNEEEMRKVAKEIGVDEEEFVEASKKIQIIPEAAIVRATEFLFAFAKIMSDMAYSAYRTKELSKEAMQAATQKSDFLANMSHEIRTPMNAVLGMAEMALRSDMDADARECIRQIQTAGKHLLVIINDILDFSKIDSGKMEIIEVVYETEDMLAHISNVVNSRIGSKNVEFIIDAPANIPQEMFGDNIRIQQILINLLNNAVKFTSNGTITLRLGFKDMGNAQVLMKASVIDTGNGIKKEDMSKLFGSFQQVDSKRNRSVEGAGLGLAICKKLAELMGGSITVSSEYGVGSTFTVEIPQRVNIPAGDIKLPKRPIVVGYMVQNTIVEQYVRQALSEIHAEIIDLTQGNVLQLGEGSFYIIDSNIGVERIRTIAKENSNSKIIVLEKTIENLGLKADNIIVLKKPVYRRQLYAALDLCEAHKHSDDLSDEEIFSFVAPDANIMIVDDNPINLKVAKGLMEPLQMNIDLASGALECVNLASEKQYDIVFMDHMMPGVDGVDTTHILRRMMPGYATIPIIALTANAVGDVREMFLAEGMNDMVAKPIETKRIIAKVREWLPKEKIVPLDAPVLVQKTEEEKGDAHKLAEKTGLDVETGLSLLGSMDLYLSFLKQYYMDIESKIEKIRYSLESKDYKTYTIEVHALKSASKQIGATELGALAASLEQAGNDHNIDLIQLKTSDLLSSYLSVKEKLETAFPEWKEEVLAKETETVDLADALNELDKALKSFDMLTIDEVLEKFEKIHMEAKDKEQYAKLTAAYKEYDIDACLEIITEWKITR